MQREMNDCHQKRVTRMLEDLKPTGPLARIKKQMKIYYEMCNTLYSNENRNESIEWLKEMVDEIRDCLMLQRSF